MSKKSENTGLVSANNTFEDGIVADMHPMSLPSSTMADALNMEFVTTEGDQYVLQNMKGSLHESELPEGYSILATKTYRNIAYIIAGKFDTDGTFIEGTIATYPSPRWEDINQFYHEEVVIENVPMLGSYSMVTEYTTPADNLVSIDALTIPSNTIVRAGEVLKFVCQLNSLVPSDPDIISTVYRDVVQDIFFSSGVRNILECKNSSLPAVDEVEYLKGLTLSPVNSELLGKSSDILSYTGSMALVGEVVLHTSITEDLPLTFTVSGGSKPIVNSLDTKINIKGNFGSVEVELEVDASGNIVDKEYGVLIPKYSSGEALLIEYNITVPESFFDTYRLALAALRDHIDFLRMFDAEKLETYIGSGSSYGIERDSSNTSYYRQLMGILVDRPSISGGAPSNKEIFSRALVLMSVYYKASLLNEFEDILSISNIITTTRLVDTSKSTVMEPVIRPLHNFGPSEVGAFISDKFNFVKGEFVDMVITGSYDGSADIMITDNDNELLSINSRFKVMRTGEVKLADRQGDYDSNVYSNDTWDKLKLLGDDVGIPTIDKVEVIGGGKLLGGGYRYYFKYASQEGNLSDIFYESPFIPISNGKEGLNEKQYSSHGVVFLLSSLKSGASRVKVFFEHHYGDSGNIIETYEIDKIYNIDSYGKLKVDHTGYEQVSAVDASKINVPLTAIDSAATLAIVNNRLIIGNTKVSYSEEDDKLMASIAQKIKCRVSQRLIEGTYSDPKNVIENLGYWKGEVYEFAVVFVLKEGGVSDAYPIYGIDFDSPTFMTNKLGVYRAQNSGMIYDITEDAKRPNITYFTADTSPIRDSSKLSEIAIGFFMVRRERLRNAVMQGITVPVITVSTENRGTGVSKYCSEFYPERRVSAWFSKYRSLGISSKAELKRLDGALAWLSVPNTKFVPQPTQYLELVDNEGVLSAASKPYDDENTANFAIYSGDLETNAANIVPILRGADGAVLSFRNTAGRIPRKANILRDVALPDASQAKAKCDNTYNKCMDKADNRFNNAGWFSGKYGHRREDYKKCKDSRTVCKQRIDGLLGASRGGVSTKVLIESASSVVIGDMVDVFNNVDTQYVPSGVNIQAEGMFSGMSDRDLGYLKNRSDNTLARHDRNYSEEIGGYIYPDIILYGAVALNSSGIPTRYLPAAEIYQKYSVYAGIKANKKYLFNFEPGVYQTMADYTNPAVSGTKFCMVDTISRNWIGNMGDLSNLYQNTGGKWGDSEVLSIFEDRSDRPYFAVTDRVKLDTSSLDMLRGDGFITRSYKRLSYKAGVDEPSARSSDASHYGVGIYFGVEYNKSKCTEDLFPTHLEDKGQGLYDLGEIIELISYTNTNADIRSMERVSPEDTALAGGDRSFYPESSASQLRADLRPDSTAYNHGYSANVGVLPYMAKAVAPVYLREFPNRVFASATGNSTEFYNSFRDIRGFSYRDYGAEFGKIEKILTYDGVAVLILSDGILAVGIDDRTLMGEGTEVYIDSAQVLSPKASEISTQFGTQNPESVVRAGQTFFGVDYSRAVIWMFNGKDVTNISEFTIKTVVLQFKEVVDKIGGDCKIYSTFDAMRHVTLFTFVAVNAEAEETHVGTLLYSTLLNRWVTRFSDGTRFLFDVRSRVFSFGVEKENELWESHVNPKRSKFRDIDYGYGFEVVINEKPQVKKILDNIVLLTNDVIPVQIVYTFDNDEADAANSIWAATGDSTIITQEVISRGIGKERTGIIDQNAYYKNSNLYIEVSKTGSSSTEVGSKKRIADKYIKIKIMYSGNEPTFIQAMLSTLRISYG